ncbi:MAG TPA: hypothetical protein VK705_07010 [Ferruginibacter sp.]|jgi:hypothetical protein|nr:hypothetical protein [Ferruginibacter sp.]
MNNNKVGAHTQKTFNFGILNEHFGYIYVGEKETYTHIVATIEPEYTHLLKQFAAAPEMLKLLQNLVKYDNGQIIANPFIQQIKEVIKKATSKEN